MLITVKGWKADQIDAEAKRFNIFCDVNYVNGCAHDAEGNETYIVREEIIKETEKAIYVKIESGSVVGSYAGWKTWIPKSAIINIEK